jgi:hypothetical protein
MNVLTTADWQVCIFTNYEHQLSTLYNIMVMAMIKVIDVMV